MPDEAKPPFLPYARQALGDEEIAAVTEVLRGDWLTTGPTVARFEAAIAARCGADHAVAVNSGTAALHAGAFALGLEAGTSMVTSPLTFAATANVGLHLGADVIFADVEADTGNLDPAAAEAALRADTRMVVPVDYAGHPAAWDAFRGLADTRGVKLMADAAHSFGAAFRGKPVGTLADVTALSFHPVKPITTAEGGALVSSDAELDFRARSFQTHGMVRDPARMTAPGDPWHQEVHFLGLNYRIPDVLCALGLAQVERLDGFLARRRAIAARYLEAWQDVDALELPAHHDDVEHGWHLFVVRVRDAALRRPLFDALRDAGLGVQVHYEPVHAHPLYQSLGYELGSCPVAEDFAARALSVPLFPAMTDDDVARVIETVGEVATRVAS